MSEAFELLAPPEPARWDSLVAAADRATVFHTAAWARVWLAEWPGARWQALVVRERGEPVAGLGFVTRPGAAGRQVFAMPDGTYGGPLVRRGHADPAALRRALFAEFDRRIRGPGLLLSQLTWLSGAGAEPPHGGLAAEDGRWPAGLEVEESRTQIVPLTADVGAAFARLPHGVRSRVRQAQESGLHLRAAADAAGVRAYHRLAVRNAERHGSRPRPLSLYLRVLEHLVPAGLARFDLVEHQARVIGGSLHLLYGGHAINWLTVGDETQRHLHPSHHLIAHWLRELSGAGYREYDLGGSPADAKGLIEFKESWGAAPRAVLTLRRRSLLHRLLRR